MCAQAEKARECQKGEIQPSFSRQQIAFLEDLLINQGCMKAMVNGKLSSQPEKCRACAVNLADMVDTIRDMSER